MKSDRLEAKAPDVYVPPEMLRVDLIHRVRLQQAAVELERACNLPRNALSAVLCVELLFLLGFTPQGHVSDRTKKQKMGFPHATGEISPRGVISE